MNTPEVPGADLSASVDIGGDGESAEKKRAGELHKQVREIMESVGYEEVTRIFVGNDEGRRVGTFTTRLVTIPDYVSVGGKRISTRVVETVVGFPHPAVRHTGFNIEMGPGHNGGKITTFRIGLESTTNLLGGEATVREMDQVSRALRQLERKL